MKELLHLAFLALCFYVPFVTTNLIRPEQKAPVVYKVSSRHKKLEKKRIKQQKQAQEHVRQEQQIQENETAKIKDESFQCLLSLGMTKVQARKKVESMFQAKKYKTVESFLLDAYKIS